MPRLSLTVLQDRDWVKEDEDVNEVNPRHIQAQHLVSMPFQLGGFALAPLAGQIATDSCCHQPVLKLCAGASAALEFERCKLASFCIVRASQLR